MFDNVIALTIILPIVIAVVAIAIAGVFVSRLVMNGMKNRQVLAHGESAPAVILKSWQTGTVMNDINPQIGLQLEVRPANRPAFQAETKMFISMMEIPQFQPGAVVQVKYDPNDTSKVAVDAVGGSLDAAPAAESADPARVQALQQMLEQMKTMQDDVGARGVSAPAMILTASDTNVKVNGDNPLMTFQLQVQATDRAPFQATAQGVVGISATAKYQPGKTIWVKYDPSDASRVVLDHS
jgi:Protein of unknown function (DUF3592)